MSALPLRESSAPGLKSACSARYPGALSCGHVPSRTTRTGEASWRGLMAGMACTMDAIRILKDDHKTVEQLFYPVARATVPGTDDIVLESLEEHHVVKWVLSELDGMDPRDERFDAKVSVLIENVRHHVKEEENDFFPKVRDELGRGALADL